MTYCLGKILVFARAPVAGQAKTRLQGLLGAAGAASLQAKLIRHTLDTLAQQSDRPVELWCAPDHLHPVFACCAADYSVSLRQQFGDDLGERMANAFAQTLAGCQWAIVVGTDCPELSLEDITAAAERLSGGADAVLGPAEDGGYYLIGLRRTAATLFRAIPWGTSGVLDTTRDRLRTLRWHWQELRLLRDLDRPEDWRHFEDWVAQLHG